MLRRVINAQPQVAHTVAAIPALGRSFGDAPPAQLRGSVVEDIVVWRHGCKGAAGLEAKLSFDVEPDLEAQYTLQIP